MLVVVVLIAAAWITLSSDSLSDNCPYLIDTLLDCVSKSISCPNNITSIDYTNSKYPITNLFFEIDDQLVCLSVREEVCAYRHDAYCYFEGVTDNLCKIRLFFNTC